MLGRWVDSLASFIGSRYAALLFVMLSMIVLNPLVGAHPSIQWLLSVAWFALLASVFHAISGDPQVFRFVVILGIGAMAVSSIAELMNLPVLYPYGAGLRATLYLLMVLVILRHVLQRREIDIDAVFGACCAYLMFGLGCGAIYALIEYVFPGSFNFPTESAAVIAQFGPETTESKLIYFSLITMTTIGFGDITPASPPARSVATVQGVIAQLYLAILVARLVAMELTRRHQQPR